MSKETVEEAKTVEADVRRERFDINQPPDGEQLSGREGEPIVNRDDTPRR